MLHLRKSAASDRFLLFAEGSKIFAVKVSVSLFNSDVTDSLNNLPNFGYSTSLLMKQVAVISNDSSLCNSKTFTVHLFLEHRKPLKWNGSGISSWLASDKIVGTLFCIEQDLCIWRLRNNRILSIKFKNFGNTRILIFLGTSLLSVVVSTQPR